MTGIDLFFLIAISVSVALAIIAGIKNRPWYKLLSTAFIVFVTSIFWLFVLVHFRENQAAEKWMYVIITLLLISFVILMRQITVWLDAPVEEKEYNLLFRQYLIRTKQRKKVV